jgi:hypothetical protein
MSRPLSCVLTPRRTLGTQMSTPPGPPTPGAMSQGRRSPRAPARPPVILDVGVGDLSMPDDGIKRCPSPTADVPTVDIGMSMCGRAPMSIGLPRCYNRASGRRTPPRPGRRTPVSPAWTSRRPPVSGRRSGCDTGVRSGHGTQTPVSARRPPGPGPGSGSDLRRGRRVAAPPRRYRLWQRATSAGWPRPRRAGWWPTGLPNSTQQRSDLDPTAQPARWHGWSARVLVGCPVGLPKQGP